MSNKALNQVWQHSKAKGAAFILMIAIADAANDEGECWMSVAKLAKKARVTDRYIPKLSQQLEELGELEVYPYDGAATKHGYTNRYVVTGIRGVEYKERQKKQRKGGRPKSIYITAEGVNTVHLIENHRGEHSSSQEMNTDSSHGVNTVHLDPLLDPSIDPKNSFASDDATSPETPQEAPKKPKQLAAKGRFTASKYYPVNEAKQEVYAKTYTPKDYAPLLEAWAKHGIVPVRGSVLNADAKYATYKLTKPPAKRSPTFDAIAECGWHMRPGFSPEVLNGNAGRVGKVITCLAEHLGKTYNEVNEDAVIAQRVRAVYAQWKVNKPNADPPKDPAAFISAWEEFTAPATARPAQQPAPVTREISADERAELARKMAEQKATLFS